MMMLLTTFYLWLLSVDCRDRVLWWDGEPEVCLSREKDYDQDKIDSDDDNDNNNDIKTTTTTKDDSDDNVVMMNERWF